MNLCLASAWEGDVDLWRSGKMKMPLLFVLILRLVLFQISHCVPSRSSTKKLTIDQYLNRYGYMELRDGPPPPDKKRKAIEAFQKYAQIPVTGVMDEATTAMLTGPRCGSSDNDNSPSRWKRYVTHDTKWKKTGLSYSIHGTTKPSSKISSSIVRDTLEKSFMMWKDASRLTFLRLGDNNNNADITIKFAYGSHGDFYAFDGIGGTLAHGFYPGSNTGIAGDIHFDDDEVWTINGEEGTTDYTWTALHEIGHALGLRHSNEQDAIMWPWFTGYKANTKLTQDDINGIQAIYGKPIREDPTTKLNSVCDVQNFDAIIYDSRSRNTYYLKDRYVWEMNEKKIITSQQLISRKWPGLESNLDSAYQRPSDGDIIFFKGSRFWRYRGNTRVEGPSLLSRYIKEHRKYKLEKIEAVMVWKFRASRGVVYFFTGNNYWRYDESKKEISSNIYPRPAFGVWHGIPFPVDSILTWKNNQSYFYKNGKTYRYKMNAKTRRFRGKVPKKHFIKSCRD